jgi:hypothetical protein
LAEAGHAREHRIVVHGGGDCGVVVTAVWRSTQAGIYGELVQNRTTVTPCRATLHWSIGPVDYSAECGLKCGLDRRESRGLVHGLAFFWMWTGRRNLSHAKKNGIILPGLDSGTLKVLFFIVLEKAP